MNSLSLSVSKPRRWERHRRAQSRQASMISDLLAYQQGDALGPAAGDVGQDERVHEAARPFSAAVCDQVGLDEARQRIVPVGEGPHRECCAGSPAETTLRLRCAARPPASSASMRSMVAALTARDLLSTTGSRCRCPCRSIASTSRRDQRLQPFAADPIGGLPEHHQRLAYRLVVEAPQSAMVSQRRVRSSSRRQHPDRVLAVDSRSPRRTRRGS